MFRKTRPDNAGITIHVDGKPVAAGAGESVAAVLLREGLAAVHRAPDGAERGPYCMMGVCFECMVECEDGRTEQACQMGAEDGMKIRLLLTGPGGTGAGE